MSSLLAKQLGLSKISVIEFGVAAGKGLICIEQHCKKIEKLLGVKHDIYGFDAGEGLPPPVDYRDCPYKWNEGFYKMDIPKLKKRLNFAELIIGDVKDTVPDFFEKYNPAPIGCLMFDLDYYSSTKNAFKIFDNADYSKYLPRIQCYFDDVNTIESLSERLAIKEFNEENEHRKIEHNLKMQFAREIDGWKIFEYHNFKHQDYSTPIVSNIQRPLN